MAYIGKGLDNGVRNQFIFAATQGQTAFSGADSDGKTLAISDILYTDCFQNGVKLEPTTDYTVTLTSLTLVNAASLNDVVDIVSFDIFAVPDTVPASTGGTFGGAISATSYGAVSGTTGTFSGNVGIGTASPQELLHLSQTGGSTIRFQNPGARVWSIGNDGTSFVVDDVTGSKETLRIDGTGVVMGGGSLAATRTADLQIHTDVAGGAVSFGDESSVVISTNATGAGSQGYIGSLWFGSQDVSQSSQYGWKMAGMAAYMSGDTSSSGGSADLLFYTASSSQTGTERMRIDASGDLFVQRIYDNATSGGGNVRVQSNGLLQRDTSSRRYKNTIEDATHGLAELLTLRTVTYKGNNDGDTVFGGLIAEEVHDSGLTEFVQYNDDNEPEALAYGNMVSLCIKAIQELSAKNDSLEARLAALET